MNKFILKSKTIWGIVVMLVSVLLPAVSAAQLGELAAGVVQAVGAALAIYGRVKAEEPLKILP